MKEGEEEDEDDADSHDNPLGRRRVFDIVFDLLTISRFFFIVADFFDNFTDFSAQLEFETVQTLMAHLSDTESILEESWANSVESTDRYISSKENVSKEGILGLFRIGCRLFYSSIRWPPLLLLLSYQPYPS